jgi:heterodisulfide reductase subunit B
MQERYAYYPGCLASLSQKELDSSTRAIAKKLQIELVALTIRSSLRAPAPKPKVDGGPAAAHGALSDVIVTG